MSTSRSKAVSLVGAAFCFFAFLLLAVGFLATTAGQLGFASSGERDIVIIMFWFGLTFLIVFGIMFLRDYYRP